MPEGGGCRLFSRSCKAPECFVRGRRSLGCSPRASGDAINDVIIDLSESLLIRNDCTHLR